MKAKGAYARLFNWYKKNRYRISEIYQREDNYSKFSKKIMLSLPPPTKASKEDMFVTAEQVMMGLLEWAYHQKDSYGNAMHQYARIIIGDVDRISVRPSECRLQRIVYEYRKKQRE